VNVGVYDDRTTSCEHKHIHTVGRRDGPRVKYEDMWYCEKYRYSIYVINEPWLMITSVRKRIISN